MDTEGPRRNGLTRALVLHSGTGSFEGTAFVGENKTWLCFSFRFGAEQSQNRRKKKIIIRGEVSGGSRRGDPRRPSAELECE